jgi:hypothetical protein
MENLIYALTVEEYCLKLWGIQKRHQLLMSAVVHKKPKANTIRMKNTEIIFEDLPHEIYMRK